MKILLLGDASNYHYALAYGLKALGHDVTIASNGSRWMNTRRDIDLARADNPVSGAILFMRMSTILASRFKGYDVVQFVSPGFVDLRPLWLEKLLRRIRRDNGALYLSALGTDVATVRNLSGANPVLEYSEWQINGRPTAWARSKDSQSHGWRKQRLADYNEAFYGTIDGAVSALYEYHRIIQAEYPALPLAYGGIPIVRPSLPAPKTPPADSGKIRLLYAVHRHREAEKGADRLWKLLVRLKDEMPDDVELLTPPNMPYDSFIAELSGADIVCDQLYSYTPATTALLAMAMGAVPISGGEDDFYAFIGEDALRPIFNPDPRDLADTYSRLRALVSDRKTLRAMSLQAPGFIAKHNDCEVVARRFVDFWERTNRF